MKKISAFLLFLFLAACSSDGFQKSKVDELIRDMDDKANFTILLYDMDIEGSWSKKYKHKYKVLIPDATQEKPTETVTEWVEVNERTFDRYVNDMGMEIASKKDGVVTKETAPPGYSNYVGNEKYGTWRTQSNGTSFWEFYGQYAFMRSMFGLGMNPIYRSSYYDYRDNYRGRRPYYGRMSSSGTPRYGTLSSSTRTSNPNFYNRMQSNSSFKNRVQSRVSSSSSSSRSGSRYGSSSSRSRSSSSRGGK